MIIRCLIIIFFSGFASASEFSSLIAENLKAAERKGRLIREADQIVLSTKPYKETRNLCSARFVLFPADAESDLGAFVETVEAHSFSTSDRCPNKRSEYFEITGDVESMDGAIMRFLRLAKCAREASCRLPSFEGIASDKARILLKGATAFSIGFAEESDNSYQISFRPKDAAEPLHFITYIERNDGKLLLVQKRQL